MQWVLEPYGEKGSSCKVYVLDVVEDTVWLEARAYNRCAPDGVAQRYWFVCSFYDVEEHVGEAKVYPNPTNGALVIEAEGIEQVRIVDMRGQVVDDRRFDHADKATMDLGGLPTSLYLVEIKTNDGWTKHRIVLSR